MQCNRQWGFFNVLRGYKTCNSLSLNPSEKIWGSTSHEAATSLQSPRKASRRGGCSGWRGGWGCLCRGWVVLQSLHQITFLGHNQLLISLHAFYCLWEVVLSVATASILSLVCNLRWFFSPARSQSSALLRRYRKGWVYFQPQHIQAVSGGVAWAEMSAVTGGVVFYCSDFSGSRAVVAWGPLVQKTRNPGADPRQCCSSKMGSFKKKNLLIYCFGALLKKGSPGFVALCMGRVLQLSHFGFGSGFWWCSLCGRAGTWGVGSSASGELLAALFRFQLLLNHNFG